MDTATPPTDSASVLRDAGWSAEMELVGLCARSALTPTHVERLHRMVQAPLDWQTILDRAQVHGVVGMVYHHLVRHEAARVPSDVLSAMQQRSRHIQVHNMHVLRELTRIAGVFNRAGVPLLTFKGPLLAQRYYGNVAFRHFGDIDVLVRRDDLDRAQSLLVANGYAPMRSLTGDEEMMWREEQLGREFAHPEHAVVIEVHWALLNRTLAFHLDDDVIWARTESFDLGPAHVSVLAPDALLLYLCAHGTKHHWSRLQCACDVVHVLDRHPNLEWGAVLDTARNTGSLRTLGLGLRLANRWLGHALPPRVRRTLEADPMVDRLVREVEMKWFGTEEGIHPPADWSTFWYLVRTRQRWSDNRPIIRHYARLAITPTENDRAFVPISMPSVLRPLYYLIRPIRLLWDLCASLVKPSSALSADDSDTTTSAEAEETDDHPECRLSRAGEGESLVQKIRRRSWAERRDLVIACCTASLVVGLLHTCSFRWVLRWVDRWGRTATRASGLSLVEERRLLWAVGAAARRVMPQRPCLTQALTARILLARRGAHPTTLQIGVARSDDGSLAAHAWLERNGTILIGGGDASRTFLPLSSSTGVSMNGERGLQ